MKHITSIFVTDLDCRKLICGYYTISCDVMVIGWLNSLNNMLTKEKTGWYDMVVACSKEIFIWVQVRTMAKLMLLCGTNVICAWLGDLVSHERSW